MICAVALFPSCCAVIVVLPEEIALACPAAIEAVPGFELVHVAVDVTSFVVPSLIVAVTVKDVESPWLPDQLVGEIAIEVTIGVAGGVAGGGCASAEVGAWPYSPMSVVVTPEQLPISPGLVPIVADDAFV